MFKKTRIQGLQGVQGNSLLAPKSIRQMGMSKELGNVLNYLNSLNSLSPKSKRACES